MQRMSGWFFFTSSMNLSAETSMPILMTSKPQPSSMEATRFLPMSWRSPFTVPMTTLPMLVASCPAMSGFSSSSPAFIARPAISNWGTKALPSWNRWPTSDMARIISPLIMSCGEAPDATAALVAVAHSAALPERMEEKTEREPTEPKDPPDPPDPPLPSL